MADVKHKVERAGSPSSLLTSRTMVNMWAAVSQAAETTAILTPTEMWSPAYSSIIRVPISRRWTC